MAGYTSQLYLLLTPSLGHSPVHLPFAMLLNFCLTGIKLGVMADAEILVLEAEMGGSQVEPGRRRRPCCLKDKHQVDFLVG